jgi:hypothetical protein
VVDAGTTEGMPEFLRKANQLAEMTMLAGPSDEEIGELREHYGYRPEAITEIEATRLEGEASYVDVLAEYPASKAELRVRLQARELCASTRRCSRRCCASTTSTWTAKSDTTRTGRRCQPPVPLPHCGSSRHTNHHRSSRTAKRTAQPNRASPKRPGRPDRLGLGRALGRVVPRPV